MKLRCIGQRILVKPIEEEYKGLVIIPKNVKKDAPMQGEVMSVGEGMLMTNGERWPMPCKPGDVVLFQKFGGTDVELEGVKYKVIRDDDVMAIIEPDTAN